jgi:hypothetical protein
MSFPKSFAKTHNVFSVSNVSGISAAVGVIAVA